MQIGHKETCFFIDQQKKRSMAPSTRGLVQMGLLRRETVVTLGVDCEVTMC